MERSYSLTSLITPKFPYPPNFIISLSLKKTTQNWNKNKSTNKQIKSNKTVSIKAKPSKKHTKKFVFCLANCFGPIVWPMMWLLSRDAPLEKVVLPFPSRYQLQIISCIGWRGLWAHFSFSVCSPVCKLFRNNVWDAL